MKSKTSEQRRAPSHPPCSPSDLLLDSAPKKHPRMHRDGNKPAMAVVRTGADLYPILVPVSPAKERLQTRRREENWMHMAQQDLDQGWLELGMKIHLSPTCTNPN